MFNFAIYHLGKEGVFGFRRSFSAKILRSDGGVFFVRNGFLSLFSWVHGINPARQLNYL